MSTPSKADPAKIEPTVAEPSWGSSYRLVASEKWKAMGKAVTEALVEYAKPKPGMQVLDLASGTGEPAISFAARVGGQGHVTALDLSTELLEIAKNRAQERGLQNFSTRQADVHTLPFDDNSFDLITSRFGIMLFRDITMALRELRRVLRPNARACFLAWGSIDQPYWRSTMGVVHRHVGGFLLQPDGPNPFRFSQPGSLSAILQAAGFHDVHEETRTVPWTWPGTPEEVWEQAQAVWLPFRPLLDRVPEDQWPQIHADVIAAIKQYVRGENIEFGASVVLASGNN